MAIDIEVTRRRFTVDEYHRMGEAGILHEDDRVELIRGEIVQMTAIGSRHAACVARLNELFVRGVSGRAVVWPQNPVLLLPDSEPQPDVVLLRRADFYASRRPEGNDVLLLVEVADTSLRYDRRVKLPLYAERGIREFWIVDLEGQCVDVYRQPTGEGYRQNSRITRGTPLSPETFPDIVLSIATILG